MKYQAVYCFASCSETIKPMVMKEHECFWNGAALCELPQAAQFTEVCAASPPCQLCSLCCLCIHHLFLFCFLFDTKQSVRSSFFNVWYQKFNSVPPQRATSPALHIKQLVIKELIFCILSFPSNLKHNSSAHSWGSGFRAYTLDLCLHHGFLTRQELDMEFLLHATCIWVF